MWVSRHCQVGRLPRIPLASEATHLHLVFLPTILQDMGFDAIDSQGLTAPPFFVSFLVTIFSTWIADRTQQRGLTIMCLTTIGGIGYILLATVKIVGVRYFGVFLAASGIFPSIANILPWVLNNQGSDTRRGAGILLLNVIGQCGPLLGTNVFPSNEAPRYIKGIGVWVEAAVAERESKARSGVWE